MDSTAFIIFVTGKYHWLMEPLIYLHEKYMPVPLIFFSDRPVPGQDTIVMFSHDSALYKGPCWAKIKDGLREVGKPLVYFGYMDILPKHRVRLDLLDIFEQYMLKDQRAARGNLWSEGNNVVLPHPIVEEGEGYSIRTLPKNDPHVGQLGSTSLLPALWSTEFILEFADDSWTLDAMERYGQDKFIAQDKWHSVSMVPGLMDTFHLCYTATPNEVRLSTILNAEDRAYVSRYVPQGSYIT